MRLLVSIVVSAGFCAVMGAEYRAPAGTRAAIRRPGAETILPGGRMIAPLGRQYITGPGAWGLAMSADGNYVVSANGGPGRYSFTVLDTRDKGEVKNYVAPRNGDEGDEDSWRSVFMGVAFDGDRNFWASEGNSGRIRLVSADSGKAQQVIELNGGGFADSYSGDLVLDRDRGVLYVVDQANFRVVTVDARKRRVLGSVKVGRLPFAIALSPDKKRVYVTHIGMFQYSVVPGATRENARETALPFPAFGFPSPEARDGARRTTAGGAEVIVPGLGDPNVRESNSVAVIDVRDAAAPKVTAMIPTGVPFGKGAVGGSSPSGVVASAEKIYVANGHNDSVSVIDAKTLAREADIEIRIAGLEKYRGVLPGGMTLSGTWLLVAEAGINAIAVIDTASRKILGHIPTGWFPARVLEDKGVVFVASAKGTGTGPNATMLRPLPGSFQGQMRRGLISRFAMPSESELQKLTTRVMELNGFVPAREAAGALPTAVKYVVLIVKENRTFDEVLGDATAANAQVAGSYDLARFGKVGMALGDGPGGGLKTRFSLRSVNVTPNHHMMAERFAFSDNFYADSEVSVDGHHWLVGSYPNQWTESSLMAAYGGQKDFRLTPAAPGRLQFTQTNSSVHPEEYLEAGALWHHLDKAGVTFRNFGEGFELAGVDEGKGLKPTGGRYPTNVPMPDPLYRNTSREYPNYNTNIPDQFRATQFINEMKRDFIDAGKEIPRFLYIHLPNDHTDKPRPEDGYPFQASYVADNDYALGRIVDFLSKTPYWKQMAIFVTEDDSQGGVDHIDSHRTVMLAVSPFAKRNYVSKVNASFPGLLKTVFRMLGMGPLNLFDAAASDLSDMFGGEPDFAPYTVMPINAALFNPAEAKEPMDPAPGVKMDDPRALEKEHEKQK